MARPRRPPVGAPGTLARRGAVVRLRGDGLQIHPVSGRGEADVPTSAAFLPDGRALTASAEGLRIWDFSTGWSERALAAPPLPVVAFSTDAGKLLLRSAHEAVVWDRAANKEVFRFEGERLDAAALSPDGTLVAIHAGRRTSVRPVAQTVARPVAAEPEPGVTALAFSPDGRFVAKGFADGALTLMEVATGRDVLRFAPRGTARLTTIVFPPDGHRIATGDEAGEVRVWEEGKQPVLSQAHGRSVEALAFSPDGRRLAAGASRGGVLLSAPDLPNSVMLRLTEAHPAAVAFSSDGRRLLTGDRAGAVAPWAIPKVG